VIPDLQNKKPPDNRQTNEKNDQDQKSDSPIG